MRSNIILALASVVGFALHVQPSAAQEEDLDRKIGKACTSTSQCRDCLKCVEDTMVDGGEWTCQASEDLVGQPCTNAGSGLDGTCGPQSRCVVAGVGEDPHMKGLRGQLIDWKGKDGGWYAILSDTADMQMSVRVTAPLPEEFPHRQLMTGVAIKYEGGHSIVIENRHPYDTQTLGCDDWFAPCLSDNALRITVDGVEQQGVPVENAGLPGHATMTAVNLPPECQPYGGDRIWAATYEKMMSGRKLDVMDSPSIIEWIGTWSSTTAAPTWCDKYLGEAGAEGALTYRGKHAVFRIQTPTFTARIHHGMNHQGGEVLYDGRVLPELEFWQIDVHLESYDLNPSSVTGMLGETIRPEVDSAGVPIMSGDEAMRGEVEDYRISGPLSTDFTFFHE